MIIFEKFNSSLTIINGRYNEKKDLFDSQSFKNILKLNKVDTAQNTSDFTAIYTSPSKGKQFIRSCGVGLIENQILFHDCYGLKVEGAIIKNFEFSQDYKTDDSYAVINFEGYEFKVKIFPSNLKKYPELLGKTVAPTGDHIPLFKPVPSNLISMIQIAPDKKNELELTSISKEYFTIKINGKITLKVRPDYKLNKMLKECDTRKFRIVEHRKKDDQEYPEIIYSPITNQITLKF